MLHNDAPLFQRKEKNAYVSPFLNAINPYIRLAWYSEIPPHHIIRDRVLYDYELVLFKSGTATIHIEDTVYHAGPGDLFLFKPGQRHSFTVNDEPLVQPHIHFDLCYDPATSQNVPISFKNLPEMTEKERSLIREDLTEGFFSDFPNHLHLHNSLQVEQLLFDVISTYVAPSAFPELRLKWTFLRLLDQLLCEISWQYTEHTPLKEERARLIRQYLDHHTDQQVTLAELSSIYHIDKSYISRIFRETFHVSPMLYHLLQRLEKAKAMIKYTNLSLSAIAELTGFSCLQDFSRAFKRVVGIVPSQYRKEPQADVFPSGDGF